MFFGLVPSLNMEGWGPKMGLRLPLLPQSRRSPAPASLDRAAAQDDGQRPLDRGQMAVDAVNDISSQPTLSPAHDPRLESRTGWRREKRRTLPSPAVDVSSAPPRA